MSLKTKAQLATEITASYPDNHSGSITPATHREVLNDFLDSLSAEDRETVTFPDQWGDIALMGFPSVSNLLGRFDKDEDEGVTVGLDINIGWATIDVKIACYNPFGSGFAGDVRWTVRTYAVGPPTTTGTTITMPAEATVGEFTVATGATLPAFPTYTSKILRVDLIRDADHVADTFTGDASVMVLLATKAS